MFKYKCLNPIAAVGLKNFTEGFAATEDDDADIILVRSAKMHEMEFSPALKAVARAGAGVNNIPLDRLAEEGVVVFNTPGANANGVKELVIFAMLAAARDLIGGIEWAKTEAANPEITAMTEKEKKRFAGGEILGKTLGVIGMGAIGAKVANAAIALGMEVVGYDPYYTAEQILAMAKGAHAAETLDEVAEVSDYISIHVPALADTKGMINADFLAKAKDGVVIINCARDTLVNEDDMAAALKGGKVSRYVSDFPTPKACAMKGAIIIPHLGASTEESEDNCAIMAVDEIKDFMLNGNIRNSVNYPAVNLGEKGKDARIAVAHKATVTADDLAKAAGASDSAGGVRGDFAYTILDVNGDGSALAETLAKKEGVLKVRLV